MLTASQIRQTFLDFFRSKGHQIVDSAPIVVKDDPTLMFNNSGMAQFKDCFLGTKTAPNPRVADTQKCLRVSGKHNDLEEVGHDTYHHTMFEMLGNWSFGDYFKKDAIAWSWELLTDVYGLPKEHLYATVFGGDEKEGLAPDEEAKRYWLQYLPESQILYGSKKDNFWEMGDTGPCGPCSEIHVDLRTESERSQVAGRDLVNRDHPQVVEIWNNVFMEFQRKADGSLEKLPAQHVDTGMGFERLCMALQGKTSTYDIDLFQPFRQTIERASGLNYDTAEHIQQVAMRVVMDHIRAIVFTICDGQIPSNTGAGYVIRRILRRASRYAFQYLGLKEPFLHKLVAVMAESYADIFPEVGKQREFIARIIKEEEESFLQKLERGSRLFEEHVATLSGKEIEGAFAFKLYDTFGFPIDLTELMAREQGYTVDMQGFAAELQAQKDRSRAATELKTGDWVEVNPSNDLPKFVGYDTTDLHTRILRYRTIENKGKKQFQIVLEETPFYAESGGQVGDTGEIRNASGEVISILDTKRENEMIVHFTDKLPADASGEWRATVNHDRRRLIRANHSATHLLHAALRKYLGTHVEQRGSLVSDELLRFDFSHFAKMSDEEIQLVEKEVNEKIMAAIPLTEYRGVPIADAKAMGAMALFGEKYGEHVRVIVFDQNYSVELCGGTHVQNTQEIRLFKLVSESSSAAGIRRVEAYTSDGAVAYLNSQLALTQRISELLNSPQNLEKAIADLAERNRQLEKSLLALNAEKVTRLRDELLPQAETLANGVRVLRRVVSLGSADDLKNLTFELKKAADSNTAILLGAAIDDKPQLSLIFTDDLVGKYNASQLIRELAKHIQGGGGGQPFYATAGGKNAAGLQAAVDSLASLM